MIIDIIQPVDSLTLRQMIVSGLSELASSHSALPKGISVGFTWPTSVKLYPEPTPTFDDIVGDYLPTATKGPTLPVLPSSTTPRSSKPDFLDGLV